MQRGSGAAARRPAITVVGAEQRVLFWTIAAVILYLVAAPLLMLIYGALSTSSPGEWGALTLRNFSRLLQDTRLLPSVRNSLVYSFWSATLAMVLGGFLAWLVQRTNALFRRFIMFGVLFPAFIPTALMVTSWLLLLSPRTGAVNVLAMQVLGLDRPAVNIFSMSGMIWVALVSELPLVFLWLSPAFQSMDPALEEAASMSGYSIFQTTLKIVLPLIAPALLGTWLIVFTLSIEELAVPLFLGIPARIPMLPIQIWLATSRYPADLNLASTYGVVLLAFTLLGLTLYRRVTLMEGKYVTITGRGYRPQALDLGRWRLPLSLAGLVLVGVTTLLPGAILLWTSFMPYLQLPSLEALRSATLNNYLLLFQGTVPWRAMRNSLVLGVAAGAGTMLLTMVAAWIVQRSKLPRRGLLDSLASIPVAVPGIVMGLSLVWFYLSVRVGIYGTGWILLIAYLSRFLPYGMRLSYSSFSQLHAELEESARVHGASWSRTMVGVVLPLLTPGLAAGVIYVMLRAFKELSASIMLMTHGNEVFSVAAFDLWDKGEVGQLAAYGNIAVIVLGLAVAVVLRTGQRFGFRL